MNNIHYIRDTKKFWQIREHSRIALDKRRANAPLSEKTRVSERLLSDARFMKTGRIISPKR